MPYEYYLILAVIAGVTLICISWNLSQEKWSHGRWKSRRMDQDAIAALDARIAAVEKRLADIQDAVMAIREKLDQ